MTPSIVLATIQAICLMITELLKFYQTEQGKKVIEQMLADRQNWDAGWLAFQTKVVSFFKELEGK